MVPLVLANMARPKSANHGRQAEIKRAVLEEYKQLYEVGFVGSILVLILVAVVVNVSVKLIMRWIDEHWFDMMRHKAIVRVERLQGQREQCL